jgi:alkanesulfonate monooxygenase SsuD/methylene tetrahydromethanopterin reductase-like flavin-dependent oxidoreductase (luciferase family)
MVAAARDADAGGLDSVWVSDHPFAVGPDGVPSGALEPLAALAALARVTRRVRIGSLVLSSTMRASGLVAHCARTIESAAPGRLVLGLGAGWYEPEHRAFGVPLPPYAERARILAAALERVAGLGPQRPALLLGGSGLVILRLAARHADEWNVSWDVPPDRFRTLGRALDEECLGEGRDPATLERSVGVTVLVGETARDMDRAIERLRRRASFLASIDRAMLSERIVTGTPEECAVRLAAYGADEVVVAPLLRDDAEMRATIIERLAPLLR